MNYFVLRHEIQSSIIQVNVATRAISLQYVSGAEEQWVIHYLDWKYPHGFQYSFVTVPWDRLGHFLQSLGIWRGGCHPLAIPSREYYPTYWIRNVSDWSIRCKVLPSGYRSEIHYCRVLHLRRRGDYYSLFPPTRNQHSYAGQLLFAFALILKLPWKWAPSRELRPDSNRKPWTQCTGHIEQNRGQAIGEYELRKNLIQRAKMKTAAVPTTYIVMCIE